MMEAQEKSDYLELPVVEVSGGGLVYANARDRDAALQMGAFLVPIPAGLDVAAGLQLSRNFYKPVTSADDGYSGHRDHGHEESKLGYSDRPDQVEQLQLESLYWDMYLPSAVTGLLREMETLTLDILYGVLASAGVRESDMREITGGLREGTGWCHSTVNHYRSDLPDRHGIVDHTDSGFITLLYADQPGLEILHQGRWRPTRVQEEYFIVNFGDGVEILTAHLPKPVTAVVHRVPESPPKEGEDRSSFTIFMGPRYDMELYQYDTEGNLGVYQGFRDFSVEKAAKLGYEFHPRL
ncbi:2OG-Fe(II) oxygenase family protein [Streptomyces sp. NPDC102381]|uniref:2OG-Fe(II) oxygenase family protein n=1 Tax=Streptomyces sp. NPDC102381 TaxID=3366164 RepID=UPI0037FC8CCD